MVDLNLPLIPQSQMYTGGIMSVEWQDFFRGLLSRVGGSSSADLDESLIMSLLDTYKSEVEKGLEDLSHYSPSHKQIDDSLKPYSFMEP